MHLSHSATFQFQPARRVPSAATPPESILQRAQSVKDLERRLKLLSADDRLLVELTLRHGLSRGQIGVALRISKGTVSRRLRRIMNQLHDPLVIAITEPDCTLAPEYRAMAIEYFLHRNPMYVIARRHQLSIHDVRTGMERVRGWFHGITSFRR